MMCDASSERATKNKKRQARVSIMSRVILSASALLALLKKEEGFHKVEGLLGKIVMSCVNVSEAAAILLEMGLSSQEVQQCLSPLISVIVPFDEEQAFYGAAIGRHYRAFKQQVSRVTPDH